MSTEVKEQAFRFRDVTKKGWPFINLEEAKNRRWASVKDGQPTKIYFHQLAKAQARTKGEVEPIRPRKSAPEQTHAGIPSPFDLRRRSGYKTIWQVLAEHANKVVSWEDLQVEVNRRLRENVDGTDKSGWYEKNFASQGEEYDTKYNAIVIARAPYNGIQSDGSVKERSIEGLKQRVIISDEGATLMTNVTEPREFKKRGRRPRQPIVDEVVENNDTSTEITGEVNEVVTA
jgi:hypothetical protein